MKTHTTAKSNRQWLAVPLVLLTLAACGEDSQQKPAGATATDAPRTYTFHGVPLSIDTLQRSVMVDHEQIEDYMEPMVMPFKVADTSLFDRLVIGKRMLFTLEVAYNAARITSVQPVSSDSTR